MRTLLISSLLPRILLSVVLFAASFRAPAASDSPGLQAGVARVDITPPLEMKAALGGYGERMSKPALGIHDSVWAKALILKQDQRKFALVTADVLGFPTGFKAAVMERLAGDGWNRDQVLLLPSHSHTSMDLMALHPGNIFTNRAAGLFHRDLFELTANRLAELVRQASRNPTPILSASARVDVPNRNRNRRAGNQTHDSDLTVTRIDTDKGQPLAVLVNWTAHPTFMDSEDMWYSGDWPGHLQRTVEALIGQGVTTMYYNGAEGDQSPTPPPNCQNRWERAERYGREMGIVAWRTWEKIHSEPVKVFTYHTENIELPKRQWHPDFMKTGGAEYGMDEKTMQAFIDQLNPSQTRSTCFRLGELVILGVPGEMATQLGMDAKAKAKEITGARCPTIGGLADEWVSYILSAEEYRKGGYEASMSFYGDTLGRTIVGGVIRSAEGLR